MTKRKNRKRKSSKKHIKTPSNTKLINILLVLIILLILLIGFILFNLDTKRLKEVNSTAKQVSNKVEKTVKKEIDNLTKKTNTELDKYIDEIKIKKDKFEEYTDHFYEEYIDKETVQKLKEQVDKVEQDIKKPDIKQEPKKEIQKQVTVKDKPKAVLTQKPKLAIVIDDVTTSYQLKLINKIGYTVTPSFMPPTKRHPDSAKIAQNLEFYMIHFPLQATSFNNEEAHTLHIGDSYEKIEKRVAQIRQWYPNAKYTNNHTGSKFTENKESMDRLFKALVKYDFIFMDSRTTGKTVGKQMAEKYNMPYIVRNVFLDNEQDFNYIQNQLKKAIRIAKKNGFAIAICHPHSITLKTLRESKHLLNDLEMVYLNQLPFLNK
ncbi:divergent polysaccharide deacetylase family protein [Arcobacter arenosus]|uniref:Divergent polysaccharide deacetylase family protein n=1 Tax=Arcobacter arenosus TaxID=2576037 RepID=A0A5R8Y0I5_9BACT|nr:divergent polysaccharide deacetylase family protein [Arcobacter arenosus]TLP38381.1 divergent polysaccharide deacetylase family protein [Arcobacter arenosus]